MPGIAPTAVLPIHAGDENMPKRKFDCGTCGAKDLSRNHYYREHHKNACVAAAVAALRQRQAPAADAPPAHVDVVGAHEGGKQGEVPGCDQYLEAAHEPVENAAVAPEPEPAPEDAFTADEPYCQPLAELLGDAEAFAAACQPVVPTEDAGPNQGPEAYAPAAAAPHDPDWQQFEGLQQHSLTEEAGEPVEADDPDAEHVYAAPEDQQFQGGEARRCRG